MILKNKTVFITGVGKGIGLAILEKVIADGGYVYALTRTKKDVKLFQNKNIKIFFGDASNINLVKKILNQSIKDKNPINCIINNAGVRFRKDFIKIQSKDLRYVFKKNFISIFFISQIFIKFWLKKKIKGNILNISSIVSDLGFSQLSLYGSSKSAINNLTKSLASEFSNNKIRINAIKPGFIKTSFYKKFKLNKKKLYNWTLERTPLKRWGEPKEVANLASFLISEDSSYINGEIINIDGGWSNT